MIFQLLNEEQPHLRGFDHYFLLVRIQWDKLDWWGVGSPHPLEENGKGRCEPREFSCTKKKLRGKLPFSRKQLTPEAICEGKRICCNGNKTPACKTKYSGLLIHLVACTIKEVIRCKC